MTRPDDKVDRRRAMAARAASLAPSVQWLIDGCLALDVPLPPEAYENDLPAMFSRWADAIQATRKQ